MTEYTSEAIAKFDAEDDEREASWKPREVLSATVSCDPSHRLAKSFFERTIHRECQRLSSATVLFRDEDGEPLSFVDAEAPADKVPPDVLADRDDLVDLADWLREHRNVEITRSEQTIDVSWPPDESAVVLLEQGRAHQPLIRWGKWLYDDEGSLVVSQVWYLTAEHLLLVSHTIECLREEDEQESKASHG